MEKVLGNIFEKRKQFLSYGLGAYLIVILSNLLHYAPRDLFLSLNSGPFFDKNLGLSYSSCIHWGSGNKVIPQYS